MKDRLILLWLLLYGFIADAQVQKIYLDPGSAISTSASQLFSSVEYIPLETNSNSIFSRMDKMISTDGEFIILDKETNAILFARKNCGPSTNFQIYCNKKKKQH